MIVVERIAGLATVQDLGRSGRMHEGLAPGGALVPSLLAAANRAAGNPDGAPAIEVFGRLAIRADAEVAIAGPFGPSGAIELRALRAGDEVVVESEPRRVAYLAIAGGVAAPLVLGGRGTQLSAGLGAPLRRGDRVDATTRSRDAGLTFPRHLPPTTDVASLVDRVDATTRSRDAGLTFPRHLPPTTDVASLVDRLDPTTRSRDAGLTFPRHLPPTTDVASLVDRDDPIAIIEGPDDVPGALATLLASIYTISPASNRVGTRLEGPTLGGATGSAGSRPLVRGAIELPPDGVPIVLGPEHPTTGGYPVIAVVASSDLDRLFARRVRGEIRFASRSIDR